MATIEGELLKDSGWRRGWRKRYFKLTKIYFQYFENHNCTSPKGSVVRGTISNVELVDLDTCNFKVYFKNESWDLKATSRPELLKWMEALKPNSTSIIKQSTSPRPVTAPAGGNVAVTTFQPEPTENHYHTLASTNRVPRTSGGSDGRSSPSTSIPSHRASTGTVGLATSTATSSSHSSLARATINFPRASNVQPSATLNTPSPNHTDRAEAFPTAETTGPATRAALEPPYVPPIESSDDDFLDFNDEENTYVNDSEVRPRPSLVLRVRNGTVGAASSGGGDSGGIEIKVDPGTPDATLSYSKAVGVQDHEYANASEGEEPSPERLRSIKSQKGQVTYELKPSEGRISPNPPSDGEKTTLDGKALTSTVFTTMKINEWVKSVKTVEKAFVDPSDQDLGTLDSFLVNNAPCLPGDGLVLLNKIGNGAFGEVWKARCSPPINGDPEAAIKILKEGATDKHRHDFYGEAVLLGQFKHPNVIALHGVVLRAEAPWIVIEYAENGALKSFLKKHAANRHSNQLVSYCRDIVRGMRYLSERGYIHRDLAARNVLLTKFEVCKIADFGLSRKLGDEDDIYVSRGGMVAIKWTAVEGILSASYSSASDVWSCGITMWEIFSEGGNPWPGFSNEEAFRRIRKGHVLNQPEKCPLDVYKAMVRCWTLNPLDRPTFAELESQIFDPDTENVEQPLYENSDGFVQYVNMQYENMPDVERA